MRASGFTFVEMLVVLVVVALVVALVPPLLAGGEARLQLAAAAREIAGALRETRSLAIREGRSEAFVLDGAGRFRAGAGLVHRLPEELRVSITGVADGRARAAIRFFADGSSTGGRLVLLRGERRLDVTVDWLTGRVALDAAAR